MPDTNTVTTVAGIETALDAIAAAERKYEAVDAGPEPDPATAAALDAAHHLVDRYRELVAALQPRPVENPAYGCDTVGFTIHGLDIHVTDTGADLNVQVGTDDLPADRAASVESWDGVSWYVPLVGKKPPVFTAGRSIAI